MRDFDLIVVGAGVAGATAALFGARLGLRVAVVEQLGPGGQIINATRIDNMPGFPAGIAGIELGPMIHEQADAAGAEFILDTVESLALDGRGRLLTCATETLRAPALIVAAGSTLRNLGVPGEAALLGRGVSHCASCDGPFFRGKRVCVIGGGDAAIDEALVLAEFAAQVAVVHRGPAIAAQQALIERANATGTIEIVLSTTVEAIAGEGAVSAVRLKDVDTGKLRDEPFDGVFIFVGLEPNTAFLGGLVALDATGHVTTDLMMRTSLDGVFAAGDIRAHSVRLLAAAGGDGATAAVAAHRYLQGLRG
ncbi:MAG TPA: FAD-dependent oxidoreductase [Candidatus Baltobacteraceae bacterium]|nr:FAD-dependent oxidoreductase [Candidatus Baltobacteraceae bacterium]